MLIGSYFQPALEVFQGVAAPDYVTLEVCMYSPVTFLGLFDFHTTENSMKFLLQYFEIVVGSFKSIKLYTLDQSIFRILNKNTLIQGKSCKALKFR